MLIIYRKILLILLQSSVSQQYFTRTMRIFPHLHLALMLSKLSHDVKVRQFKEKVFLIVPSDNNGYVIATHASIYNLAFVSERQSMVNCCQQFAEM